MASSRQPIAQQVEHLDLVGDSAAASNRLVQVSLILGIASCIPGLGVIFCIPAIICGHLALRQAHRASHAADIRVVVGLTLGYVIAAVYAWMVVGLFIVPSLSGR